MPGTTPRAALPYPVETDPFKPSGAAGDLKALADRLDILLPGSPVTALPGSPADGQVVYFQNAAMAIDGVVWQLRYNAGSASSYKWELIGGAPWVEEIPGLQTTTSTSYTDLGTSGPSIAAPLAGEYVHRAGATAGGFQEAAYMSFAIGASAANDARSIRTWHNVSGVTVDASIAREQILTLSAGDVLLAKYKSNSGGLASFERRWMSMLPVRVA